MKVQLTKYIAVLATACLAISCSSTDEPDTSSGTAIFALRSGDGNTIVTDDTQPITLRVIGDKAGVVLDCKSINDIPQSITLLGGRYTAFATVGDSVPASFDKRYFKGMETFVISKDEPVNVILNCKIANTAVKINYADNVDEVLHDYVMTVGHSAGNVEFKGRDTRKAYFMMPSANEHELTWTLHGTTDTGTRFEKTGTIRNVSPATLYTIDVSFNGIIEPMGGFPIDIVVDTNATEINYEDIISAPPLIEGIGCDISKVVTVPDGGGDTDIIIGIGACAKLSSLVVTCDKFIDAGLPAATVDFVSASDDTVSGFLKKGIRAAIKDNGTEYTGAINLSHFFLSLLPVGETIVNITAVDGNGMTTQQSVTINVTPVGS